jgi:hypothetical protein
MVGSDPSDNSPVVFSLFLIFYGNALTLLINVSQPETMRTFLVALTLSDCNYLKTIVQHAIIHYQSYLETTVHQQNYLKTTLKPNS